MLILLASIFESSARAVSRSDYFVGHPAPDFTLKDLNGQDVQLSSFKGKIVLLDFWATWCGPCRAEIPTIESIAKHFAKKDVVVIGVNSEEAADVVRGFVIKNKLTYPIVLTIHNRAVIQAYGATALPTVVVIDKDGIIAAYRVGESPRTEDVLRDDIHHVSSAKYVAPQPKTIQIVQRPPAPSNPSAVSRSAGPDPNWQPETAEEFLARGYARLRTHMYPQAKADAEEALKRHPAWPTALFLRGRASYEDKDYVEAIADFDEVIRQKPDWPEGYHYRGLAYSYYGQHQRAVPDYEKLIQLRPYLPAGYNDLGWALRELGELDEARTKLDKAIELEPDYVRARENRAILFEKQNDWTDELNEITIILDLTPNDQWAKNNREAVLQKQHLLPGAQQQTPSEAIQPDTPPRIVYKIEPEYTEEARRARVNAMVVCSLFVNTQGVPENIRIVHGAGFGLDETAIQAVSAWRFEPATRQGVPVANTANVQVNFRIADPEHDQQIASLNFTQPQGGSRPELVHGEIPKNPKEPEDARVRVALSVGADGKVQDVSLVETTSPEWADKVMHEVKNWRFRAPTVSGGPTPVQGIFEISRGSTAALAPGSPVPAAPGLQTVSTPAGPDPNWQPKTADEFLARGFARLRIGKYAQSRADAEEALKLRPDSVVAEFLHGRAAYEDKDYLTAIQDFNKVIGQKPDWPEAYRWRGLAYSSSSQHEDAVVDEQQAIKLDPYLPSAYNALGWSYSELGESELAKTNLDSAIELEPDFIRARENRATLFGKIGDVNAEQQELAIILGLSPTNRWAKDTLEAIQQNQRGERPVSSPRTTETSVAGPR